MNQDIEELGDLFSENNPIPFPNQSTATKEIIIEKEEDQIEQKPKIFTKNICKIYIRTFGCSHNQSDSEYMAGLLEKEERFEIVKSWEDADLVIVNSCTVKNPSQDSFLTIVKQAKAKDKYVIVAGCVPQAQKYIPEIDKLSIIGITQIDQVVYVADETLKGNTVKLLKRKALPSLKFNKIRMNSLVEIIPISGGCLGACSYCKTVQARGKLTSYPINEIFERVKQVYYYMKFQPQRGIFIIEIWGWPKKISSNYNEIAESIQNSFSQGFPKQIAATLFQLIASSTSPAVRRIESKFQASFLPKLQYLQFLYSLIYIILVHFIDVICYRPFNYVFNEKKASSSQASQLSGQLQLQKLHLTKISIYFI